MSLCHNCGIDLEDARNFCRNCGAAINETGRQADTDDSLSTNETDRQADADESLSTSDYMPLLSKPEREKLNKKTLLITLAPVVAVLATAIFIIVYLVIQSNRASSYEEATAFMNTGKYKEAQEIFTDLGEYNDSEELVLECQRIMDYNAATLLMEQADYLNAKLAFELLGTYKDSHDLAVECQLIMDYDAAKHKMDNGNYIEAKPAFLALGSFRDSDAMAVECQLEIDYAMALEYKESGDYTQALEVFVSLGTFKDTVLLAEECENWIAYEDAMTLKDAGKYVEALVLLEPLAAITFEDSSFHMIDCYNILDYAEAENAFNDGLFYTAYTIFQSLWGYMDSNERAEECIQEHPSTGQIYRNPDFNGSAVSLRIKTPKDDPRPTLIKIYTEDGIHVSSVFIRGGDSPTVKLPADTYMLRSAHGDTWFGPDEMFGDENAYYQTLLLEGSTTYAFRRNYDYSLTLRDAIDGNVGTKNETRSDF